MRPHPCIGGGSAHELTSDDSGSSCRRTSGRATGRSARAASRPSPGRSRSSASTRCSSPTTCWRQALLLGQLARAADDAGGRRRRDRARPARHVDPDHAAAQPGHPGQGAGDAPVPVRQPGDPRRRRRLERGRVRGGRRPQVGARQAHRRDARHHDAAARGRDASPTTASSTTVDDVFIEPRTSQRPLLWIGGGSQLADPKSPDVPKFVESVKAPDRPGRRLDPAADLPAAGHRPRLGGAPGRDARGRQGPERARSSRTRTSCTWS